MLPLIGRALLLVVVGAGAGLAVNALRANGVPLAGSAAGVAGPEACVAPVLPNAGPPVAVLPPSSAAGMCGDPRVLIADARSEERFMRGHVAGAIHLPCAASGASAADAIARLEGKHTLIVYGDTTEEARPVALDLRRRIDTYRLRVVVLEGGFPSWSREGLACSSGPCPTCEDKRAAGR